MGKAPSDVRQHRFLAFFDEEAARKLAESAQVVTLKNDELIFREGDAADSIYLVLKGSVRLTKKDPARKEQFLAFVSENDFFGEFGVLDGKPRSAGARAAGEETVLARIPRDLVSAVFASSGSQGILKLALHIVGKVRDINERYVEERLRKERMTLIGEMADRIIHDLKSPFCVIQLVSDMLRRNPPADLTEHCDLLESQIVRMQTMVEEILEFSRGKSQLTKRDVNVLEILGRFQTYNMEFLKRAKVELVLDPVSKVIDADGDKLLRVIQNIVNNAVEAFRENPGTIWIQAREEKNNVYITIKDNGPGLPEDLQAKMFEPFATKGKAKGTGLGMAIAKSIVQAHEGEITFDTASGKGTTFHIRLPVRGSPATQTVH